VTAAQVIRAGTATATATADPSAEGAALQAALEQHYAQPDLGAAELPDELLTALPLPDGPALASFLSDKAGRSVRVGLAKRSAGALAGLATRNAAMEVQFAARRHADADAALVDLAALLAGAGPDGADAASSHPPPVGRLEAYDVSHTAGAAAVASRVVFIDGVPVPSLYRRYHLRAAGSSALGSPNDFASLAEALARRFCRSTGGDTWPDVVLIDGGKGQLSAAVAALAALGIDVGGGGAPPPFRVLSLAKRVEEVFVPGRAEPVAVGAPPPPADGGRAVTAVTPTPAVLLLMRLRDEAHRHAVRGHRALRGRDATASALAGVPGVGRAKRSALLAHFSGSAEAVAAATEAQLREVAGVGPALAKSIHTHFHPAE